MDVVVTGTVEVTTTVVTTVAVLDTTDVDLTITTGSIKVVDAEMSEVAVSVSYPVVVGGLVDVTVVRSACKVIVTVSVEAGTLMVVLMVGPEIVSYLELSYIIPTITASQHQANNLP